MKVATQWNKRTLEASALGKRSLSRLAVSIRITEVSTISRVTSIPVAQDAHANTTKKATPPIALQMV